MKKQIIFSIILGFNFIAAFAQNFNMPTSGSGIHITCSGFFYDDGGSANDYSTNVNSVVTLYPSTPEAKVSVTFNSFSTQTHYHDAGNSSTYDDDILYVYNGNSTAATQIGAMQGVGYGTVTSTAPDGSLTFKFVSHTPHPSYAIPSGSRAGWSATISCSPAPPTDITMIAGTAFKTCGGNFYDGGGPGGDYMNNQNNTVTLYPSTPEAKVSVTFNSFSTQTHYHDAGNSSTYDDDILYVYNGNSTAATQIGAMQGVGYGTVTSTAPDGSLTFKFVSHTPHPSYAIPSGSRAGWSATISCSPAPPTDITMIAGTAFKTCGGNFYDGGGPGGDYMNNQNNTVTLYPSTPEAKVSVTFNSFSTQTHYHDAGNSSTYDDDILYVYNGNSTAATQIGAMQGVGYGTVTSTAPDGSLTFKFVSHTPHPSYAIPSGSRAGWSATISCSPAPPTDITMIAGTAFKTCGGNFYDGGGPGGDYMNNQNNTVTLYPSTPEAKVSVTFNSFSTQTHYHDAGNSSTYDDDILYVYNGNSTAATQIGAMQGLVDNKTIISTAADGSLTFKFVSHTPHPSYAIPSGSRAGWNAFINCGTLTAPVVNSITFTNDIKNHTGFEPFPLYSGSATVTNNPVKICADGSTATYIKVNVSNTTGINFQIIDSMNNVLVDAVKNISTDPEKFGRLGIPYTFGGNNVEVAYTHPQYMDASGVSRRLRLKISYGSTEINGIAFPLDIYRAPIVFVHGLGANNQTFEAQKNDLVSGNLYPANLPYVKVSTYNGSYTSNGLAYTCSNCPINTIAYYNPLMHLVDYSQTNGSSFSTNARKNVIANGIDSVFKSARFSNYSCGQVILIGHSMGGILSRLYLQNSYKNSVTTSYRSDIQKLITINTPHYGSQFANYMLDPVNASILRIIGLGIELFKGQIPALLDLRVNSNATRNYLNMAVAKQNKVPSHTISTIVTNPLSLTDHITHAIAIKSILCLGNSLLGFYSCKNIFNYESNDEIVPLSSQKGGFNWAESDNNRFHEGSNESEAVKLEIKDLINSSPFNSNFSNTGFAQKTLKYNIFAALLKPLNNTVIDSIKILNIINGQTFNSIDSINIIFSNSSGINNIKAYLVGGTNTLFEGGTSASNSNIKFKPDPGEVGERLIYLLGYDSSNFRVLDSVHVNFTSSAQLDSIKISPRNINLPLGYSDKISIEGYYHDGIIRDLRHVPGLTIAFDTNKIKIDSNYIMTGKTGPYKILLTADYLSKQDTILVETTSDKNNNIVNFENDNNEICVGSPVSFSETSLGIVQSRFWQFPGGIPNTSTLPNPVVTYNTTGFYKVTLITTFTNGIDTLSIDSLIQVDPPNRTISSGDWNDPSVWSCNSVPLLNDSVVVASGHTVTLNTSSQIRKLYIENGGSISSNDSSVLFTIGSNLDKTSPVICDGSMIINSGKIKIFGNLNMTGNSVFNMAGGNLIIDGNTGQSSTSIPDGQHLFNVYSDTGNFHFSGGLLQFTNPPLGSNSQAINCSNNFDPQSTVIFGDGLSTVASNNPNGFGGNLLPVQIGKLVMDAATTGNNRVFKNLNPLTIKISCEVRSGKIIQGALLQLNN